MMKFGFKGKRTEIEEARMIKQSAPKDMHVEFKVILRWLRIANARREPWTHFTEEMKAGLEARNVDSSRLEMLITKLFEHFSEHPFYLIDSHPMMERNLLFMTMSLNQKLMLLQVIDEQDPSFASI
jgi:hypothetical protein